MATAELSADLADAFRRWGYLEAALDPLGRMGPEHHPELAAEGELPAVARVYTGPIGVEFMHLPEPERRQFVEERMEEPEGPEPDRERILDLLIRAEVFEQALQARYLGTKRFSLEGVTALIPLLDEALAAAARQGARQVVLAMSHRGRLNVMAHVVGIPPAQIFAGFEDVDPRSVLGGGDVKYHLGATGTYATGRGEDLDLHLVSNPSHLEAVDPVAVGRVWAKQQRWGEAGKARVLPILLHGDAAFAGQGILAETLNLADLPGYSVGGTVHVVVNNLIGFTTPPASYSSTRFATDVARRLPIPILHVNGEEPEAVVRAIRLAVDYRYAFGSDVVVDLIGYRRHGHSEVDDPTITQPLLYRRIANHPPLWRSYARRLGKGDGAEARAGEVRAELDAAQKAGAEMTRQPVLRKLPSYWDRYQGGRYDPASEVAIGLAEDEIAEIAAALVRVPQGFHVHPKIARLLEQRAEMGRGERPLDFAMAEALAFGSLVCGGVPVRLSGQDSRRGTFNQRHAVLIDIETGQEHLPLAHVAPDQAPFEAYDSMLSEAAVLGFEYGVSRDFPEALVLWEAQFGDFANGAQVILDQFVCAGEDKWGLLSGLVVLLPHGYEGQGPEHSSARMERFLQLAAEDNIQVCQPSTAAQYFHLLRRQALRAWRKPLIVFTPKSMLRHPAAASDLGALTRDQFSTVCPEREVGDDARRLILCTGKIVHELREERKRRGDESTAIVTLEQLYPFPEDEVAAELKRFAQAREVLWVQEEPANMGALPFARPYLERLTRGRHVRSVKRSASASPATGSAKAHAMEQKALLALAFAEH